MSGSDGATARTMWRLFEPVHAVVYFAAEAREAFDALGMRGFWMSYVAARVAPIGAVGPDVATATFYGFDPSRADRALPDAWSLTTPEALLRARKSGSAAALRRLAGRGIDIPAELADLAWQAAHATDVAGRILGAANRALPRPADPVEALWQACTTLREHRGDGHIAALVAADVGPVASHLLKGAAGEVQADVQRTSRAWSEADWSDAGEDLVARGLLGTDGRLTDRGVRLRDDVEAATDRAALTPWSSLGPAATTRLADLLAPVTAAVRGAGLLPTPNPIGLV